MSRKTVFFFLGAAFLFVMPNLGFAAVRFVKPVASGTGDGSSWANASGDLQAMINSLPLNQLLHEIWMAEGTYVPKSNPLGGSQSATNRDNCFYFSDKKIGLFGGFKGHETDPSQRVQGLRTILSGDLGNNGSSSDNCYHVLLLHGRYNVKLDAVIVTRGNANGSGNFTFSGKSIPRNQGGGIYMEHTNDLFGAVAIFNSAFVSNFASQGSAIYDARFELNSQSFLFNDIANTLFISNVASPGGYTIYSVIPFLFCQTSTFHNNVGGGIYGGQPGTGNFISFAVISSLFSPGSFETPDIQLESGVLNYVKRCIFLTGRSFPGLTNLRTTDFQFKNAINPYGPDNTLGTSDDGLIPHYDFEGVDAIDSIYIATPPSQDFAGNARPGVGLDDIGAYESPVRNFRIWCVKEGGTGKGTSWADASGDLNKIIDTACGKTKDQIWVAQGTYKPTQAPMPGLPSQRDYAFKLRNRTALYGGFLGTETSLLQRPVGAKSILSGDVGNFGQKQDNVYHVVVSLFDTATTMLDGFQISDGNANGSGSELIENSPVKKSQGGGIYLEGSQVRIQNTSVLNCEAQYGGGILMDGTSSARFTNVDFQGNFATTDGGGVFCSTSSPSFTKCLFVNNRANGSGGALVNSLSNLVEFEKCYFKSNEADKGGAIFNFITKAKIRHSVFYDNTGSTEAGAILTQNTGSATLNLSGCSFVNNKANGTGKGKSILSGGTANQVNNSIFWGSETGEVQNTDGSLLTGISYSIVQGNSLIPGMGNKNQNPDFLNVSDPFGADNILGSLDDGIRISPVSPAKNASHPDSNYTARDISGKCRFGVFDMGAYESTSPSNRLYIQSNVVSVDSSQAFELGTGLAFADSIDIFNLDPDVSTLQSIQIAGPDASSFSLNLNGVSFPLVLSGGGLLSIPIQFQRNSPGTKKGRIVVTTSTCDTLISSYFIKATEQPVLGEYGNKSMANGGNLEVIPALTAQFCTSIHATTNPKFKGIFLADPLTGKVKIINAHPAGNYQVTVSGKSGQFSTQKTFLLTVSNSRCSEAKFTNPVAYNEINPVSEVVIGDFNGDGNQDLVSAHFVSAPGIVSVRSGNGNGNFAISNLLEVGTNLKTLTTADFNGDGKMDIATAGGAGAVSIRLGNGNGGFSETTEIPSTNPQRMASGDFNQDGNPDLVVTNGNQNRVQILMGDGSGNFIETGFASVGLSPNDVAVSDFNNDGKADLAISLGLGSGTTILLGDGAGQFPTRTDVANTFESNSVSVADFNNDGKMDWLNTNFTSNSLTLHVGNGLGGSSDNFILPLSGSAYHAISGDFNGDGHTDIASLSFVDNQIEILTGDGTGSFTATLPLLQVPFNSARLVGGDFNGDGVTDLVNCSNSLTVFMGIQSRFSVFGNNQKIENGDDNPSSSDHTDFGTIELGQSTSKTFRIKNSGTGNLKLDQIQIFEPQGFTGTFLLSPIVLPAILPPGDSTDIGIQYQPTGLPGSRTATIELKQLACNQIFTFQVGGNAANPAPLSAPVISVSTGTYPNPVQVSISSADPNTEIWYTDNGNLPRFDIANGFTKKYTGPIQVIQTTTIRAVATKPGQVNSPVSASFITITNPGICGAPVFSPASGSYEGSLSVNISTATSGAEIWYTTNGNLPRIDIPNSFTKRYQGPFTINQSLSVRAMAVKSGLINSGVSTANYVITNPTIVDQPIFGISPGSYPSPQVLSISTPTSGAQIFYTTNGNEPRFDVPNSFTKLYSTPLLVNQTMIIRAVAVLPNNIKSKTTVGTFTIGSFFRMAIEEQNPYSDKSNISIYPNPSANGIFKVDWKDKENEVEFELTGLDGRAQLKGYLSQENQILDLTRYYTGIYILRVYQNGVLSTFKLNKL